jgi:flagellin-like hook-associated protein FlgL
MNSEVSALKDQISNIVGNTKFNGQSVFGDGSDASFSIQAATMPSRSPARIWAGPAARPAST